MVSKLAKRGMPTDSLERALRWRRRNLEPGRVKGQRAGTDAGAGQADAAGLLADRDQAAAGGDRIDGDIEDDVQHPVSAPVSFQEVRSRREAAEASLAELKLESSAANSYAWMLSAMRWQRCALKHGTTSCRSRIDCPLYLLQRLTKRVCTACSLQSSIRCSKNSRVPRTPSVEADPNSFARAWLPCWGNLRSESHRARALAGHSRRIGCRPSSGTSSRHPAMGRAKFIPTVPTSKAAVPTHSGDSFFVV